MRQGQHKNRSRGRNQRRPGNPSNRVFESNGPDVKVRGTAQTVADKYLQLARDAVSSGDIVMSESYYQHAEHYIRIIAATQANNQQQQQQKAQEAAVASAAAAAEVVPGTGPQPQETPRAEDGAQKGDSRGAKPNGETAPAEQPAVDGDGTKFDGELPQFLKKPADEDGDGEKPKRGRRPSSRGKAAKSDGDGADKPAEDSEAGEDPSEPASDAEAAVG